MRNSHQKGKTDMRNQFRKPKKVNCAILYVKTNYP